MEGFVVVGEKSGWGCVGELLHHRASLGCAYSVKALGRLGVGPSENCFLVRKTLASKLAARGLLFLVSYIYESRGDRGFAGENISNAQPHASSAGTTLCPGS